MSAESNYSIGAIGTKKTGYVNPDYNDKQRTDETKRKENIDCVFTYANAHPNAFYN